MLFTETTLDHFESAERLAADIGPDFRWQQHGPMVERIIEHLWAGIKVQLGIFWSHIDRDAVREQIVQQILRMDSEYRWDAPRMSDAVEDMLLTWLTNRVIDRLEDEEDDGAA